MAAGDESGRGADYLYRQVSGTFKDVGAYCTGGVGDGVEIMDSEQVSPTTTASTTANVAKKNGSHPTIVKPPIAHEDSKKAAESEAREEHKKR